MTNPQGYEVEFQGSTYSKTPAKSFRDIKRILKTLPTGHVSVVRCHDRFEIYVGEVSEARFKFGL
jgi:hypothetical protein